MPYPSTYRKTCFVFSKLQCVILLFLNVYCVNSDISDIDRLFSTNQGPPAGGYIYPSPPQPPVQLDEPASLPPLYLPSLPPIFSDEIPFAPFPNPPPTNYPPPAAYLPPPTNDVFPPVVANDDTVVIPAQPPPPQSGGPYPPSQGGFLPPQFRIENMSCTDGMNFRATFKMAIDPAQFPVVDEATESCISPATNNAFKIDLENFNSMLKCGVRRCTGGGTKSKSDGLNVQSQGVENMCVVVRIPVVRGVRLPEDGMVTLMCTPQERVVSQTRHVKLGSNRIQQVSRGRSNSGFVATGGTQKGLKTRIGIFRRRPGSNVFDQNVQSDSVIQLGEDLVLRAVVNEGDGWKSSQIGPVLITGLNSKKSALLINQHGCVNPVMKSVCPKQPFKINPLCTELHFRAFLFQESPQGDEMVVSVRTQGCLHSQDCTNKIESCSDDPNIPRSKRELTNTNDIFHRNESKHFQNITNGETKNWETELLFKVGPVTKRKTLSNIDNKVDLHYPRFVYVLLIVGIILSMLVIVLLIWQICFRQKKM